MLTHQDRTVPDALAVYDALRDTDLRLVGFKDVGVDPATLRRLTDTMHADGRTVMLEVVSTSSADELASISAALDAGVDYILGGTNVDEALTLMAGADVRYCPFPGKVTGHPSELGGSIDEIAADARRLTARDGVHGVDLLAYRHRSVDVGELTDAVVAGTHGPVIVAGSITGAPQIERMAAAGAWAFTIGSAIFDGRLPQGPDIAAQIRWVLEVTAAP